MEIPISPYRSCKITVVASRHDVTFPYFLWILLSFTMFWNVGCGFSVDDRVYACSTSLECGAGWVCQCTGNSVKGGQCVGATQATGVIGVCSISELADFGSGTTEPADVIADISWQDVADIQVEPDSDAAPGVADVREGSDVDDVGSEVWADASIVDAVDATDIGDVVLKEDVWSVDPDGSVEPDAPDAVVSPPDGMIYIPNGTLWMGCNEAADKQCGLDEKPQHEVTVSAYFIDTTEVTVSAYAVCVSDGVCLAPGVGGQCNYGSPGNGDHPVNCVTWCQARNYCLWNQKRLPTEAEWEMAGRGSCKKNKKPEEPGKLCQETMRTYPWGEAPPTCEHAVMYGENDYGCDTGRTWEVGSKSLGNSPYGVKDMSGNVWEWVEDCWGAYSGDPVVNPPGVSCVAPPDKKCQDGDLRVVRGGGFDNYGASYLRVSNRGDVDPSGAISNLGFRCAKSIP